ncbi:MAG: metal ABC transporter substrate-binding protein [Candidatus Syntrophonatronum acetioxidans]|uniref:Metal ABC transporter substrate-binding protein n=1 Tax=Candidatus Syntrophonatronum acetioxidans TaxID=1795816 RepID=A0A424YHC0_9FIRM|nr:MAG: metal ABC transporter substrate-binding protein [Candidatus Syntrophonatronum acetioxidans]
MFLKRIISLSLILVLFSLAGLLFSGCSGLKGDLEEREEEDLPQEGLNIVTSFSILGDIVENITGDRGKVEYLVPLGENPEDYELLSREVQMINDAHVFLVNGFGLEGMMEQAVENVTETPVIPLTRGMTPLSLVGEDTPDPHLWLAPLLVRGYVDNALASLIELDPEGEGVYRANAEEYKVRLKELDRWVREQVEDIPQENKLIIVSENAFKYFGEAYGFQTEGIWELNSHEEGTPQQISRIVELVKERELPGLFVESTLDSRFMEAVSRETGVPVAGIVYTDALGERGSGAETYENMIKHNVEVFVKGLAR